MHEKGEKFIALFLVFCLFIPSANLLAKERRGANLVIQKKDGKQVKGELIAVKQNSLLLKESESGADVSIDIGDIKVIKVVRESKAWSCIGIGALAGVVVGLFWGTIYGTRASRAEPGGYYYSVGIMLGIPLGAATGGVVSVIIGRDKTIRIEGKSDSEIKEALEKLRKKARVRDFQ